MNDEQNLYEVSKLIARIVENLHDYFDKLVENNTYYDAEILSGCIHDLKLIQKLHKK